jgi:CheY-like chemotaxis protein
VEKRDTVTHKLFLADDSVTIQRVVELTFSGEDVQVVTVGDGEQAIARIPVEHPDIVLADIGMPKRSGYEVAAFVKGRPDLSHIPVLLLAGAFEPVDEARALQVKSDGVLVKPFEPQQVIARVRELIDGGRPRTPQPVEVAPVVAAFESRTPHHAAEPRIVTPEPRVAAPEPKVVPPEPRVQPKVQSHEPRVQSLEPAMSSEDYFDFDRLDAAFARLGTDADAPDARRSTHNDDYSSRLDVPTVDSLLASAPLHDLPAGAVPRVPLETALNDRPAAEPVPVAPVEAVPSPGGRNMIADVFSALFAAEQGEAIVAPLRLPAPPAAPAVTDELVEEVTRRVIQRLAPGAAHEVVAKIVSDVAERLVREEIARIKSAAAKK